MDTQAAVPQQLTEQESIRREKLRKLRQAGQDPYAITRYDRTHESTDILNGFDELEGKEVSVAGRMISKRVMGKASFATFWTRRVICRFTCAATTWARRHMPLLRTWTSAT